MRGTGPVHHPFGDGGSLIGPEFYRAVFEVYEEATFENEEEFVVIVVLVPVKFAFDDADAYHAVVDLCECLVPPFFFAGGYYGRDVDDFLVTVRYVEVDVVFLKVVHRLKIGGFGYDGRG